MSAGALSPKQLRGPLVVRVIQGVYRPAWVPLTHRLKCEAAALVLPEGAAISGVSAAAVRGHDLARPDDDVLVRVGPATPVRKRVGLVVRTSVHPVSVSHVDGLPLASPLVTAFDLAARRPLAEAVGNLDLYARGGGVDLAELSHWLHGSHDNDVVAVRAAVALGDPRAESRQESAVRVHLALAGIHLVPQHEIWHRGRLIARSDLADVDHQVAVEYDGAWHALRGQLQRDRARLNALGDAGWTVVHVTADLLRDPAQLVAVVRAARLRASA
ncbi:hypothetical protein GCM10027446_05290 [Angustibacter peucedani]